MKRILFVEDDAMIASGLIYALEQEGYGVVHCKSVSEAVDALSNERFDLALLDMQLPDGTEDYITKPFRLRELLARIKRTLDRQDNVQSPCLLTIDDVSIDTSAGKVYLGDSLIDLTALEYRLLLTFASNKGVVLTRAHILDSIWDVAGNYVEDNTLTVYVKRLREKLGEAIRIETVRGIGYRVH